MAISAIVATVAGLVVGAMLSYFTPRVVAYRLEEPPEPAPLLVLVPLIGGALARWRPLWCFAVSVATAAVFGAIAHTFGESRGTLILCGYSALLIQIALVDFDHRLVLNRLSYPGVLAALVLSYWLPNVGIRSALLGGAVAFILFYVIEVIGRGAMGPGDTKLATLIGVMRGFPDLFNALLTGVILGGVAALILLTVFRRGRKDSFAYGPYLAAGAVISFFIAHTG